MVCAPMLNFLIGSVLVTALWKPMSQENSKVIIIASFLTTSQLAVGLAMPD